MFTLGGFICEFINVYLFISTDCVMFIYVVVKWQVARVMKNACYTTTNRVMPLEKLSIIYMWYIYYIYHMYELGVSE